MRTISINDALTKAFKRKAVARDDIENFRHQLYIYLTSVDESSKEAKMEGYQRDFLRSTFYRYYDVTKPDDNNIDCAIRLNGSADAHVAVIIENKAPENIKEMVTADDPNRKAMQELVYYFLIERIEKNNTDIRHLIATNMYELFIFDASVFETLFYDDNSLCREFCDFRQKMKTGKTTDEFYAIASQYIDKVKDKLACVHVCLNDYRNAAASRDDKGLKKLVPLFKLLSDTYMMKLPVRDDYNSLDKDFYRELLYIIGLQEIKDKGKPVLTKIDSKDTNAASLMDLTMDFVDKKLYNFQYRSKYGETKDEQLFNISLELCTTWVNRLLFLRLLESQIVRYHNGDEKYRILGNSRIDSFQTLNRLFFDVLAVDYAKRNDTVRNSALNIVPYLNSSLFELTFLENRIVTISALPNNAQLPLTKSSVLRNPDSPYRKENAMPTLRYLLAFLDSYRFASEEEGGIEDSNAPLINASVLGLIFEKINGHKDGAVFTPSFITSAMSRPAVEQTVVKKFNDCYDWQCTDVKSLVNRLDRAFDHGMTLTEANEAFNAIRIADISVGSGHFLVSVLGELIRLKFILGILTDTEGIVVSKRDYDIDMVDDELSVLHADGNMFRYLPGNPESQRIQEALFHEKQRLIENCLFGVDLNGNSVGICRLRLWIELLKNTYYTKESQYEHLRTLPNLDINIKQGDSLLSKFSTGESLSNVLHGTRITISSYKSLVSQYKATADKEVKHEIEGKIKAIKSHMNESLSKSNPNYRELAKNQLRMLDIQGQIAFFQKENTKEALIAIRKLEKEQNDLAEKIAKQRIKTEDNKKKFEGSFEWRFEFPEILDAQGKFIGFDLIIGNPPYIQLQENESFLANKYAGLDCYRTFKRSGDIYYLFIERAWQLLAKNGVMSLITSNKWLKNKYGNNLREFVDSCLNPEVLLDFGSNKVFENADVLTDILVATKTENLHETLAATVPTVDYKALPKAMVEALKGAAPQSFKGGDAWLIANPMVKRIMEKMETAGKPLIDKGYRLNRGILTGRNDVFIVSTKQRNAILADCKDEEERRRTEKLFKKILQGENIHRNKVEWGGYWLINTHNGLKEKKGLFGIEQEHLERIHIEEFPALEAYLDSHWDEIKSRSDKGDTPYNLRNCAYLLDFDKPKIVWGNLNLSASYAWAGEEYVVNAPANQIVPASKALLHLLNSRLADWYVKQLMVARNGGYYEYKPMFVGRLPVPDDISMLEDLTDERQIDAAVCKLYGLDDEEAIKLGVRSEK